MAVAVEPQVIDHRGTQHGPVGRGAHSAVGPHEQAGLVLGADPPPVLGHVRPAGLRPAVALLAAGQPRRRRSLRVRAKVAAGHGRLDRHPELRREVLVEKVARLVERVLAPERAGAANVGQQRLGEHHRGQRRRGERSKRSALRQQVGRTRDRVGREQRERGVGGQQPAPEVARLNREVGEQRERQRHEDERPDAVAPQQQNGSGERRREAGPAEPPGEAVEVVAEPARLLAGLGVVGRDVGLVAQVAPPIPERREQVGIERHERDQRGQAGQRQAACTPQARPGERRHHERQGRQAGRVLERRGDTDRRAAERPVAETVLLVGAHGEQEGEGDADQRADVGDRDARVGHRQKGKGEHGCRHETLASAPEPPRGHVDSRHAPYAQQRGQRAGRYPDLTRVLAELLGHVAEREVEEEAERPVHPPQQQVDEVGVGRGILVVARVDSLAEHAHRAVGEVRRLVDRVNEGKPVVVVPHAQGQARDEDERQNEAVHAPER